VGVKCFCGRPNESCGRSVIVGTFYGTREALRGLLYQWGALVLPGFLLICRGRFL
jgi:hypothetical protein